VYENGQSYFIRKVSVERILSLEEAQDLTGESFLEFQKSWLRIRCLEHYTRRMFRNNLMRHLKRKRRRRSRESFHIEAGIEDLDFLESNEQHSPEWERYNDLQRRRLSFSNERVLGSDENTRVILALRLGDTSMTYRDLEPFTGMTEAAMRMRFARFCKSTRILFEEKERRRAFPEFN